MEQVRLRARLDRCPLMVVALAALGAAIGVPVIAGALCAATPVAVALMALGVVALTELARRGDFPDTGRLRAAWAVTAWLLVVGVLAVSPLGETGLGARHC